LKGREEQGERRFRKRTKPSLFPLERKIEGKFVNFPKKVFAGIELYPGRRQIIFQFFDCVDPILKKLEFIFRSFPPEKIQEFNSPEFLSSR
jgi:hypothetical protein